MTYGSLAIAIARLINVSGWRRKLEGKQLTTLLKYFSRPFMQ
ncbi:hypothetical protein Pla111_11460 [Botrimarina hoheduenensis]|uniref:Uncharacterized protein n=1 Tax=Botrimarina hoheduenensis TaxID=2528000 RepID=A0A5C5WBU7_9BACT|nr:hypothetical protein Pla111_11460 [Botrimarina hoheduenensis]